MIYFDIHAFLFQSSFFSLISLGMQEKHARCGEREERKNRWAGITFHHSVLARDTCRVGHGSDTIPLDLTQIVS